MDTLSLGWQMVWLWRERWIEKIKFAFVFANAKDSTVNVVGRIESYETIVVDETIFFHI